MCTCVIHARVAKPEAGQARFRDIFRCDGIQCAMPRGRTNVKCHAAQKVQGESSEESKAGSREMIEYFGFGCFK